MHIYLIRLFYGLLYAVPVFLLTLTACGGGGGGSTGSLGIAYLLSGTTVNLTSPGLILSNSGVSAIEDIVVSGVVSGNTGFWFSPVAAGESYNITVKANPSSPSQRCAVTNASSGVMTTDVTDVVVSCDYRMIGGVVDNTGGGMFELEMNSNLGETISVTGVSGVGPFFPYSFEKKYADNDHYEVSVAASGVCQTILLSGTTDLTAVSQVIESGTITGDVTLPIIYCF